jgi:hypothetical protein
VRIPGGYAHAPEHPSHGRVQLKAGSKPTGRRRRGSPAGDAAERKEAKDHRWSEQTYADTATKGAAHDTAPRAVELSHRVRLCQTPSSTTTTTHSTKTAGRQQCTGDIDYLCVVWSSALWAWCGEVRRGAAGGGGCEWASERHAHVR